MFKLLNSKERALAKAKARALEAKEAWLKQYYETTGMYACDDYYACEMCGYFDHCTEQPDPPAP